MEMSKLEKAIIWFKYDYLPRVGAYRKDCKQGCDACMPLHDGDNYCDIYMLCKILALLKEQEHKDKMFHALEDDWKRLNELLKEQQEIVRCMYCIRRGTYDCPVYVGGDGMCSEPDDWYCADGERK